MKLDSDYIKIIFGLKIKELRSGLNLSLQEVSDQTGLSKSYLNEIEKGKKYPKPDKIALLTDVLKVDFDELVSTKLSLQMQPLAELLRSDFFTDFPLVHFGFNKSEVVNMISESPKEITALINAVIHMAQSYNLGKERFYFAVMRSFQEMHLNYFDDLENKAKLFIDTYSAYNIKDNQQLILLLSKYFEVEVEKKNFDIYGTTKDLRSLYLPNKKLLLLNEKLSGSQTNFILKKEIGYQFLALKNRPLTYSWVDIVGFEMLVNNFYASYFAGSLSIPLTNFIPKLQKLFAQQNWQEQSFENLMFEFTNSPETFYYRITNVLSSQLGINDIFYLCFVKKNDQSRIQIIKELHLNHQQSPQAKAINEHYCERWVSIKNLRSELHKTTFTDCQISHYKDTGLSYLVISTTQKNPFSDGANRSYTLGILLNKENIKKIKFSKDENIPTINVGVTCETCSISNCNERQAPAHRVEKDLFNDNMKKGIKQIINTVE